MSNSTLIVTSVTITLMILGYWTLVWILIARDSFGEGKFLLLIPAPLIFLWIVAFVMAVML